MPDLPGKVRPAPLNLRQIEVFHAIMITGSLSAAGRLLHVSQPAISRVLAAIELRLGYTLFERVKGRLYPSKEARRLFQEVESIQAGVGRLNTMAANLALHGEGHISVVSSLSFSEWMIPKTTARFTRRYPGVQVRYRPLAMDALLPQLLLGHADIGISTLHPEHPNLVTRELAQGNMVCVLPSQHRLAREPIINAAMLADELLIGYETDTPLALKLAQFWAPLGRTIQPAVQVRSAQTACAFVRSNVGVALVDGYGVLPSQELAVRPITPAVPLSIHVSHSCIEPPPAMAKAFLSEFTQTVKRDLPEVIRSIEQTALARG